MKNKWGEGQNTTYYHDLVLEGVEGGKVSIGAKQENPDFLAVGQEIDFEWKDQEKRSIKKAAVAKGFGSAKGFVDQSSAQFIVAAMNNATALKIAGAIPDGETMSSMIQKLTEHAVKLKKELQ